MPQTVELRDRWLPAGLPEKVELKDVPFFAQDDYQCGPAALAMVLKQAGVAVTPQDLVPQVYLPARQGSLQVEMLAAARRNGLVAYRLAPTYDALLRELAAGTPAILLQNLGLFDGWHYAVAIGYDFPAGELVLRSGLDQRKVMNFGMQEMVWKRGAYWAMVALPPDRIPVTAEEPRWLDAVVAYERSNPPARLKTAWSAFLSRWPDNVTAAIGLANAHYALGELPAAETALREALKRDPASVPALNNLAQTLSDLGRNQEALDIIQRAAADPGRFAAAVEDTRATILKRLATKKR